MHAQLHILAYAFFSNPLDKLSDMMGPTDGPISLARKNFAAPVASYPGLREVCAEPPVFAIDGFLSDGECDTLVESANSGHFPAVPYGKKNQIFTGTKWAAHEQTAEVDLFLERSCEVFGKGMTPERFDPVTVTKYGPGQFQAKHLDARLPHQINRNAAYIGSGGQRIAQLICYIQEPDAGGATKFFGPAFGGLDVPPQKGTALIFPTATLDGLADERYLHSGEPVTAGTKYIIGSWLMEAKRTDGASVRKSIKELWKLEGREPPRRAPAVAKPSRAPPKTPAAAKKAKKAAAKKGKKKK